MKSVTLFISNWGLLLLLLVSNGDLKSNTRGQQKYAKLA